MGVRLAGLAAACAAVLGAAGCGSGGAAGEGGTASSTGTSATLDGRELFVNGDPSTGAAACGACHTLKAAGTSGTAGNDLDKLAKDVGAAEIAVMTTDPDATIAPGYPRGVMPRDYGTTLTPAQVRAVAEYVDRVSARTP